MTKACRWEVNGLILVLLTLAPTFPQVQPASAPSAREAFRKMQNLAGEWEGEDDQGHPLKTKFLSVASNTAIMETLAMPEMEEMVTLYSLDIDSILLIHYCPTNNQPRMRAVPTDNAITKLEFVFTGAGNLPDSNVGHEQKLVLQFTDEDHITERWTWRRNGKDTEMVFRFVRIGPGHKSSEKRTRD
jgi:hypothetical protein